MPHTQARVVVMAVVFLCLACNSASFQGAKNSTGPQHSGTQPAVAGQPSTNPAPPAPGTLPPPSTPSPGPSPSTDPGNQTTVDPTTFLAQHQLAIGGGAGCSLANGSMLGVSVSGDFNAPSATYSWVNIQPKDDCEVDLLFTVAEKDADGFVKLDEPIFTGKKLLKPATQTVAAFKAALVAANCKISLLLQLVPGQAARYPNAPASFPIDVTLTDCIH